MTQTNNRFFDEIGRLMNDAAGAAQGVKREVDTVVRNQAERILRDLDIVKREEFEAVKDMARLAREENEALKARIAALEAKLGGSPTAAEKAARGAPAGTTSGRGHKNPRISLSFEGFGAKSPGMSVAPAPLEACYGMQTGRSAAFNF
jgi:BMFP domain-containing protein YqiC